MKRWEKIMLRVGRAISTGGLSEAVSNYEELEEAKIRTDWEIMRRKDKSLGTILQKIGVIISDGGFLIEPKGKS